MTGSSNGGGGHINIMASSNLIERLARKSVGADDTSLETLK